MIPEPIVPAVETIPDADPPVATEPAVPVAVQPEAESAIPTVAVAVAADTTSDLVSMVLTPWNVLLMVAVWTIIQAARKAAPDLFLKGQPMAKVLPIAPILMCQVATFIHGPWIPPHATLGQRLVLGTVIGACTSNLHAILSKLGLQGLLKMDVKH